MGTQNGVESFRHVIAYIDPGVGTMIVQFIAAFFVGSALYFHRFFGRVFRFVFRLKDKNGAEE